jgi:hypothetical protein
MLKNQKAVSRERLIGISFVDILIQAVFILFLALTVGYTDPMNLFKIKEYEQAGRDLCNKVNKDSVKECREVIDPIIDKELNKGMLALCIKPESSDRSVVTARFIVTSPTETKFLGFTPQYFTYLEKKGDKERLAKAKSVAPGVYGIKSIDQNFSFLMEPKCIHIIFRDWEGTWDRRAFDDIFAVLSRLGGKSKQ